MMSLGELTTQSRLFVAGRPRSLAADSAVACASCWIYVSVDLIVGVPFGAVCLGLLLLAAFTSSFATLQICLVRDGIKVIWANALRVSAKMIQVAARLYRATQKLVAKAMSQDEALAVPEITVSKRAFCRRPKPAVFCFFYLWPKTILRGLGWSSKSAVFRIVEHESWC